MQPYQLASEEMKRQGELPIKALTTGASLAASAGMGGLALNKVLPFLNQYIPNDIAIKGLSKIDPRFGKFISKALENGTSFDEIKDFIKEKVSSGEQQQQKKQAPNQLNIIQQYDDNLHSFMENLIKQGRSPLEAGALARASKKFEKSISKMEKDHKTNFSSIIESVYGQSQPNQSQNQPIQSQPPIQQPKQVPQQSSDAALLAALDKILKM